MRCTRPVESSKLDPYQITSLEAYLKSVRGQALILTYDDPATLATHVDTILTRLVTHEHAGPRAEPPLPRTGTDHHPVSKPEFRG